MPRSNACHASASFDGGSRGRYRSAAMSPGAHKSVPLLLILVQVVGICCCWTEWSSCDDAACGEGEIACLVASDDAACEDHLSCSTGIAPSRVVTLDLGLPRELAGGLALIPDLQHGPPSHPHSLAGIDPPERCSILRC